MSKSCKQTLKTKDFYKIYKKTVEEPKNMSTFSKVINMFCTEFKKTLFNGSILNIPGELGKCYVSKRKINFVFDDTGKIDSKASKASIDYGKTNKLWAAKPELKHKQYVYHTNDHTNGYRFRLTWKRTSIRGISFIVLNPLRCFKRELAKFTKENFGRIDYYSRVC
jgi:hypothetical protein